MKQSEDPRYLGAEIGMTMVLHTHNRKLDFHPHIHVVVPGGGRSLFAFDQAACITQRVPTGKGLRISSQQHKKTAVSGSAYSACQDQQKKKAPTAGF